MFARLKLDCGGRAIDEEGFAILVDARSTEKDAETWRRSSVHGTLPQKINSERHKRTLQAIEQAT